MKTDKLLQAFSRQNELELEISTVREDQKSALQNTSKLESDVCMHRIWFSAGISLWFLIVVVGQPCCTEVS